MDHPITPPPALVRQWLDEWINCDDSGVFMEKLATQAARWGADQELEACIDVILAHPGLEHPELLVEVLRAARRPKPPSLVEEALDVLNLMLMFLPPGDQREQGETIRRALERLQHLEQESNDN